MSKDGKRRLIAWSNAALPDKDGSVEYVIRTGIDVTDHRKAEEALLREKKFSDMVIDSLPGMFYVCDEQGTLIQWNNNVQEVTGYSGEELSRMNVRGLFLEDRDLFVNKLKEVFDTGKASAEARILTKRGARIPFLLTGLRMLMNDNRYLVGVGIDISERMTA